MENKENEHKSIKKKDDKEHIKEYNKKYYVENRTKALEYMATKINCDVCNCTITRGKRSHHLKSSKHTKNLKIKELEAKVNAI